MASDDIVRLKGDLWNASPVKFKKHILTHIDEFKSFNPNSFLNINYHLVVGTAVYDHKVNLCQVVDSIGMCGKCELAGTIDCNLGITKQGDKGAAERILDLTRDSIELFKSLDESYARVSIGGHLEIHPINGRNFKEYLSYLIYQEELKPPSADAITNARAVLSAKARFDGNDFTLHNRVAWYNDALYYDLTNHSHEVVEITQDGWDILDRTEIPLFKRYGHQKSSAKPVHVENPEKVVKRVLKYLNHDPKDKGMQILILVSLITSFIPDIPHCVIIVYGDQGSAKTWFLRILRSLIDPSDTITMSFPRSKDLNQVLDHNWFCGFDNVGGIPRWLSDALCRAVTGDGNVTRQHYSNDDDFIRKYKRVIALNGINNVATQPDLLDRSVLYKLKRLTGKQLRLEKELIKEFKKDHPEILGAIFSILSKAYNIYPTIKPSALFRLADWTVWGCAVAQALGYDPNDFTKAYSLNKEELTAEAIGNDDVATALVDFIHNIEGKFWKGRMTELLPELIAAADRLNISTNTNYWPKAPNAVSRRLNPFATPLREAGIRYEMVEKENRIYEIEVISKPGEVPTVKRGLENYFDTSDGEMTIPEDETVSEISAEKTGEPISDDTDDTDDIMQRTGASIPLLTKKGESGAVKHFKKRWQTFLERTSQYDDSYTFAQDELSEFYTEDEMGQLQQDLKDWEKASLVFYIKTKKKEGWRVADRGAPTKED